MKLTYLLDTNILSELTKPRTDPSVLSRFEAHEGRMGMPAPVWHELLYGLARLPPGRRQDRLRAFLLDVIMPNLPVLPYDEHAAWIHAEARSARERAGQVQPFADAQIAAIAVANNLVLVSRNLGDFTGFPGLMCESWFGTEQ
jgi:tRNA(fMet)-specific endonuclease VapC